MRDIQLHSNGKIQFTAGETHYFFSFPVLDASHPVPQAMAADFSACVALLAELRKTEKFTVSFEMRTDIPAEKMIPFSDLTISVHSLVDMARRINPPPQVP